MWTGSDVDYFFLWYFIICGILFVIVNGTMLFLGIKGIDALKRLMGK